MLIQALSMVFDGKSKPVSDCGKNVNKGVYSLLETVKLKPFFNIHNCYKNYTQKLDHYIIFHFRMTLIK